MAFGDCQDDEALRAAWIGFCRRLEESGDRVFKDYNPATPLHRADGFRFLTQNLGQVFDLASKRRTRSIPCSMRSTRRICKLGGDAADFIYQQAWIDGESVYKVSGNRGTARFLNFTVQGPRPEKQPGTDWPEPARSVWGYSRSQPVGYQLRDGLGWKLRALYWGTAARAKLAADDAALPQTFPASRLRPLDRVAGAAAHRAHRHGRAEADYQRPSP